VSDTRISTCTARVHVTPEQDAFLGAWTERLKKPAPIRGAGVRAKAGLRLSQALPCELSTLRLMAIKTIPSGRRTGASQGGRNLHRRTQFGARREPDMSGSRVMG
jgi:hypothetical protein